MKLYLIPLLAVVCAACTETTGGQGSGSFKEPVPETIVFDGATLSYFGDESMSGVSDLWSLDLTASGSGNSAVRRIVLSLNAECAESGMPGVDILSGTYHMPANSGDMSVGTFNPGYMYSQDRPNGAVSVPAGSFYVELLEETPLSDADLLREGQCSVETREDGTVRIEGVMVGTEFLKRYFVYEGAVSVSDMSGETGSGVPNTNLTGDIELVSLAGCRLTDKGDSYVLGDESYRHFEFYIADAGIDLSSRWPGGDGELLRLELFVPWETDPADGVPEGVYTVPEDIPATGGVYRKDIVPFRIVPGYPDKFTGNTGTWYQYMEDGLWVRYARITGGSVTVERPEGRYRVTIDLTDCGSPAHHVRGVWEN